MRPRNSVQLPQKNIFFLARTSLFIVKHENIILRVARIGLHLESSVLFGGNLWDGGESNAK